MGTARNISINRLFSLLRRPGFWFIVVVLVLISIPHYVEVFKHPSFVVSLWSSLGLDRHAFERVLYLAPIVWAGFVFGWKGAFITSLFTLALMLPRALFISEHQRDSFFEIGAVFLIGNVLSLSFASLRREREFRRKFEAAHKELQYYVRRATIAQEEERKRISHELHDDTVQSLVALSRQLDALAGDKEISDSNRRRVEELLQQTGDILKGVRRLSQDLRPAALDRLGLLPAIQWLADDISKYSGVAVKVAVTGAEHRLPEDVEIALFRIVQEALRNAWRHAAAAGVEIKIEFLDEHARITVSDNGKGFKLPEKVTDMAQNGKLGLAGMQERAHLIGGTLAVQSEPGEGTVVTVTY